MRDVSRRFRTFVRDRGAHFFDVDHDPPERIAVLVERLVEAGYWQELDRFPVEAVTRSLPYLQLPTSTRRLVETWVEERVDGEVAA